ncbi:hypothetical protein NYG95_08550 [Campylobacter felis]|uniref:Uncharacterized protein n=1 Tax=Campylobacter felis TaxID=2974565 RepID=A0ABT7I5S2_9BACT|nr:MULTISPECIES: hypothetical protein [Campylobacter]MDL0101901.1 hypothetical protein [Campylobacter felis]MDL0109097.1 hypothetical protein [Campylobacter felis]MDL0110106.1 hypothetical protein [Campylobacter felis]MDL0147648.1 hypothetical protein [Campylobacter felis]
MYRQRVKNVSYLSKIVVDLDSVGTEYEALVLPRGAEVLQVSLEVLEEVSGTLDVGLNETQDFFINDLNLNQKNVSVSAKVCEIKEVSFVKLKLTNEVASGKVALRVLYFLPSEVMTEY